MTTPSQSKSNFLSLIVSAFLVSPVAHAVSPEMEKCVDAAQQAIKRCKEAAKAAETLAGSTAADALAASKAGGQQKFSAEQGAALRKSAGQYKDGSNKCKKIEKGEDKDASLGGCSKACKAVKEPGEKGDAERTERLCKKIIKEQTDPLDQAHDSNIADAAKADKTNVASKSDPKGDKTAPGGGDKGTGGGENKGQQGGEQKQGGQGGQPPAGGAPPQSPPPSPTPAQNQTPTRMPGDTSGTPGRTLLANEECNGSSFGGTNPNCVPTTGQPTNGTAVASVEDPMKKKCLSGDNSAECQAYRANQLGGGIGTASTGGGASGGATASGAQARLDPDIHIPDAQGTKEANGLGVDSAGGFSGYGTASAAGGLEDGLLGGNSKGGADGANGGRGIATASVYASDVASNPGPSVISIVSNTIRNWCTTKAVPNCGPKPGGK